MHLRERITSSRERKNCTRQYTQKTLAKVQRPQAGDPDLPRQTQPKKAGLREGEILQELRKAPAPSDLDNAQNLSDAKPLRGFAATKFSLPPTPYWSKSHSASCSNSFASNTRETYRPSTRRCVSNTRSWRLSAKTNLSRHVIFKGPHFDSTGLLDVRTHFKPTETFQYTHFSSCHPASCKKGFVKGEALRYLRNNSVREFRKGHSELQK